jgi:hypothetical protein
MLNAVGKLRRYIVCGRVTKRPIFAFVEPTIHPNDALMVFPYEDDYSFGILQSAIHWTWFINRCSTLKGDPRYTSNTVFDTFAWPQEPSKTEVAAVAAASLRLREVRLELQAAHELSLRELYPSMEQPGKHPLKDAHGDLELAVRKAYGMSKSNDPLVFLLTLNLELTQADKRGDGMIGPGLPPSATTGVFVSDDAIRMN